jgi:hypothetical protein
MSAVDPRLIMVVTGGMGTVAQGLAAWWWFKVSSHELSDEVPDAVKELREMGRLNARAAIAQASPPLPPSCFGLPGRTSFKARRWVLKAALRTKQARCPNHCQWGAGGFA